MKIDWNRENSIYFVVYQLDADNSEMQFVIKMMNDLLQTQRCIM